ncbi:EI24 domain-containing protein [Parenemella sanctibonifatiensis]|nr:EI24 domain-containing protein [Parenemella sanctibonifatiensis]
MTDQPDPAEPMAPPAPPEPTAPYGVAGFLSGVATLGRGFGWIVRRKKLLGLGLLPPLIVSIVEIAAIVWLAMNAASWVASLTGFMGGWDPAVADLARLALQIMVTIAAAFLAIITFVAVTLAVGAPIYDLIAEEVDKQLGLTDPAPQTLAYTVVRTIGQLIVTLAQSALVAVGVFVIGLIPVVGQVAGIAISFAWGSWAITKEVVGTPFQSRGLMDLVDRSAAMRSRRMYVFGFGLPTFALMAIPGLSIIVFPAAVAGGVLVTRGLLGDETSA